MENLQSIAKPESEAALVQRAKRMALAHLNENRKERNAPPLKRLEKLWWSLHFREWIEKARAVAQ